jgi:hypothetical protein
MMSTLSQFGIGSCVTVDTIVLHAFFVRNRPVVFHMGQRPHI